MKAALVSMVLRGWAAAKARTPIVLYTAHGFYFHDQMKPWLRRAHVGAPLRDAWCNGAGGEPLRRRA